MSFYNMLFGVSPAAFFVLPMLGKHAEEYPRFRDCFLDDKEHPEYVDHIHVYTRTGGGNREAYESENAELQAMPGYVTDFDDSFDCTFASFIFKVPDEWKDDFVAFKEGRLQDFSPAYQQRCREVYPKLKDKFDELWGQAT